jgi:hypothetical protein
MRSGYARRRRIGRSGVYISDSSFATDSGLARVEAHVSWEDADNPPLRVFAEVPESHAEGFWPDANAFLILAVLPAWRAGERRVHVEGSLCPVLCENVRAAITTLQAWYADLGTPPAIECSTKPAALCPRGHHAVSLLSCGVDSLALLRWNKLHVPVDHPAAITGTLLITFEKTPSASSDEFCRRVRGRLTPAAAVASDAGVEAIPVVSNAWWLVNDGYFYDERWHGAVLSSAAAFFSRRFRRGYIASSSYPGDVYPWGSHPWLDPYYSSSHFQVENHGLGMSRLERTAIVADWPAGLNNVRVCQKDDPAVNCGTCEKCIRTMTALVSLGKLRGCGAFAVDDVSAELIGTVDTYDMLHSEMQTIPYRDMLPALTRSGRDDLAAAVRMVLRSYAERAGRRGAARAVSHWGI